MSIVDLKTLIYSKTYTPPYLISHTYIRIFYFHGPLLQYPCSIPKLKNLKNGYIEYFEQLKKNKKKKKKKSEKNCSNKKKASRINIYDKSFEENPRDFNTAYDEYRSM